MSSSHLTLGPRRGASTGSQVLLLADFADFELQPAAASCLAEEGGAQGPGPRAQGPGPRQRLRDALGKGGWCLGCLVAVDVEGCKVRVGGTFQVDTFLSVVSIFTRAYEVFLELRVLTSASVQDRRGILESKWRFFGRLHHTSQATS